MSKNIHELEQIMFPPDGSGVKPYEWMINPTRQRQWIDKQGIFLWLAFFFSEIGAGLYFVSLFYAYKPGLILGWLVTLILGGMIHIPRDSSEVAGFIIIRQARKGLPR
jgi:hypothetical protein